MTTPEARKYCRAKLFSAVGKRTPVAVRFSTVGGESGSADTARDPRGFAVKFYTEDGQSHTDTRDPASHSAVVLTSCGLLSDVAFSLGRQLGSRR